MPGPSLAAAAVAALAGYVVGALPIAWLLVRRERGVDLRRVGSGGTGALDALAVAGPSTALLAVIVEALKGGAVGLVAHAWDPTGWFTATAIAGCVVGDAFPAGFRRGGRGLVPLISGLFFALPQAGALCAVIALPVALVTRMRGRVYDAAVIVAVPLGLFLDTRDPRSLIPAAVIVIALVLRAQLRRGARERAAIANRQHPLIVDHEKEPG